MEVQEKDRNGVIFPPKPQGAGRRKKSPTEGRAWL